MWCGMEWEWAITTADTDPYRAMDTIIYCHSIIYWTLNETDKCQQRIKWIGASYAIHNNGTQTDEKPRVKNEKVPLLLLRQKKNILIDCIYVGTRYIPIHTSCILYIFINNDSFCSWYFFVYTYIITIFRYAKLMANVTIMEIVGRQGLVEMEEICMYSILLLMSLSFYSNMPSKSTKENRRMNMNIDDRVDFFA